MEGLLFVSAGPVAIEDLAAALHEPVPQIERALTQLDEETRQRGIRLQRHGRRVQFTSAPELAGDIERFLNLESTAHLTRAALEVLAIIAYQEPVTRPRIDSIRGVNSDSVLGTLLRLGLISEAGRTEGPGRPILYTTTPEFLQHFGLSSLGDLPPLAIPQAGEPAEEESQAGNPAGPMGGGS